MKIGLDKKAKSGFCIVHGNSLSQKSRCEKKIIFLGLYSPLDIMETKMYLRVTSRLPVGKSHTLNGENQLSMEHVHFIQFHSLDIFNAHLDSFVVCCR